MPYSKRQFIQFGKPARAAWLVGMIQKIRLAAGKPIAILQTVCNT